MFTRHVDGVRLAADGELPLGAVKRMESALLDIARARNRGATMRGEVRLSVTEGLGTFWLAPRPVEFQRNYPELLIGIRCAMHPADVLRLESDIAVQITRPTAKDLRLVKIGRRHSMPFASRTYPETHGTPKSFLELSRHHLVLQVADQLIAMEEYARMFPETPQLGTVSFRVNVSSAYYWLIARGGGIGILPTYAQAIGGMVVPIDVEGVRFVNDIWLTYHPDAAMIERVRRLIDWLIEAFSPRKYPWFGEEFIHPWDLPRATGASSLQSIFEGFERDGVVPAAE